MNGKEINITLTDGMPLGDDVLKNAVIRELDAAILIDAQIAAEQLVETKSGPQFVSSPARMGLEILRRQVVRIDDMQGPVALSDLKKLSARDMALLQAAAETMDAAIAAEIAGAMGERGRADAVGADG